MSGTPHIRSLSIALESTFGSIDSSGVSDASVLTFVSIECERANIVVAGETPVDERPDARSGFYMLPPEPNTACDQNGNPLQRRNGQMTIDMVVTAIGSATTFADYAAMPVGQLLNTVMQLTAPAAALGDTTGAGGTANLITPGVLGNYSDGQGIAVNLGGKGEYSFVTDASGPNVTVSPAFSAALPTSSDVRIGTTFSVRRDGGNTGVSVALRADGVGFRSYGVGCRVASVTITPTPHLIKFSFVVEMAYIYDDNNDASVTAGTNIIDPVVADGCAAHMLQTTTKVSTLPIDGLSAPASSGQTPVAVDEFSSTLTWTLGMTGTSETPWGFSDYEVTDFVADVNIIASQPSAALTQSTFLRRQQHGLVVGLSNVSVGNGLAMYLPAAAMQTDPNVVDLSGDIIRTAYNWKQGGPFPLDVTSPGSSPSQTTFRLLLGN